MYKDKNDHRKGWGNENTKAIKVQVSKCYSVINTNQRKL